MEIKCIRQGMGIMHSDVIDTFFHSGYVWDSITQTGPCNIQQYFTAVKIFIIDDFFLLCLPPVRVGRHIVFPLASVCL